MKIYFALAFIFLGIIIGLLLKENLPENERTAEELPSLVLNQSSVDTTAPGLAAGQTATSSGQVDRSQSPLPTVIPATQDSPAPSASASASPGPIEPKAEIPQDSSTSFGQLLNKQVTRFLDLPAPEESPTDVAVTR